MKNLLVATIGGVSSTDIHNSVYEVINFRRPYNTTLDYLRLSGSPLCTDSDVLELSRTINEHGDDLRNEQSLFLVAKSAGGVLAWRYATLNWLKLSTMFSKTVIVLVDPHGAVTNDNEFGPYCKRQALKFPKWLPDEAHEKIKWYNVYQWESGLTGASFPDYRVVMNININDSKVSHNNIPSHKTTKRVIDSAFSEFL